MRSAFDEDFRPCFFLLDADGAQLADNRLARQKRERGDDAEQNEAGDF